MKIIIQIIALILLSINIFSQTPQENLKKYWQYRERLKYFVVATSENNYGTNIPASKMYIDNETNTKDCYGNKIQNPNFNKYVLKWADGNGQLQYYIGLLATEYYLLKKNNIDYTQTKNELFWALQAVESLDKTAESYFREYKYGYSFVFEEDLNGFLLEMMFGVDF